MRILRLVAFFATLVGLAVSLFTISFLPKPRRFRSGARALSLWGRTVVKLFGIRVSEAPHFGPTRGPRVIVANHLSYLDIPVLLSRGPCVFVAKQEIKQWPVLGRLAKAAGTVFVKRGSLRSRAKALNGVKKKIRQGLTVVIFPEGTTSLDGPRRGLASFFAGAFGAARRESVGVEAVYLDYADSERVAWLGDEGFLTHLWTYLRSPGMAVRVRTEDHLNLHTRGRQRAVTHYCRSWLLEGGRNMLFLRP